MKTINVLLIVMICIVLPACKNANQKTILNGNYKTEITSGSIVISGAFALNPLVETWVTEFNKKYPDIRIDIHEMGTGQGIKDILNEKANLAMISRELNADESADSMWKAPVARGGVIPLYNNENPNGAILLKSGLNTEQLQKIFTSTVALKWSDLFENASTEKIVVFSRAEDSGAADVFAGFLNTSPNQLTGNKVESDEEMIEKIRENKYSLGFCNHNYVFDIERGKPVEGIRLLPIDMNFNGKIDRIEEFSDSLYRFQRKIWAHRFPRNLCRTLYMVSNNVPNHETKLFMKWVLTEGQDYVVKCGFCELNSFEVLCALNSLN